MQILFGRPIGVFDINTKSKSKTKHDADTEIKIAIVIEIKSGIKSTRDQKNAGEAKCGE